MIPPPPPPPPTLFTVKFLIVVCDSLPIIKVYLIVVIIETLQCSNQKSHYVLCRAAALLCSVKTQCNFCVTVALLLPLHVAWIIMIDHLFTHQFSVLIDCTSKNNLSLLFMSFLDCSVSVLPLFLCTELMTVYCG